MDIDYYKPDWTTWHVYSDYLEEQGKTIEAEAFRYMVEHKVAPTRMMSLWFWEKADENNMIFPEAELPEAIADKMGFKEYFATYYTAQEAVRALGEALCM